MSTPPTKSSPDTITVATTQMACGEDPAQNLDSAEALVRKAAGLGAKIILLQELFETPYFCKEQNPRHFALARPFRNNRVIARFAAVARELGVVLPISFFEKSGPAYFNSLATIDADGSVLGLYRKSHIPQGPGYQEKYYFSPGDTGFQVFSTHHGLIGCAICWDQWFPEAARAMALQGAELLFYPSAIGSEPEAPHIDSRDHWRRTMQGHAAANMVPVIAANRIGMESGTQTSLTFYGSSFITDGTGAIIAEAGREQSAVITATFDRDRLRRDRAAWGLFRDRRADLYVPLLDMGEDGPS